MGGKTSAWFIDLKHRQSMIISMPLDRSLLMCLLLVFLSACGSATTQAVRIATFNTALSRPVQGQLHREFAQGDHEQAKRVAEILQRTRPDIVLLQEIDHDPTGKAYDDFQDNYLSVKQNGAEPIHYQYVYAPEVNTGVLAEVDLDGDGKITRPNDCYGYGLFEGQYGMVVLSKFPIEQDEIYTFRNVLWQDMPRNIMPRGYYKPDTASRLRLSSKTHASVPVRVGNQQLHLLISHPTPPVFDGPEDRNGRRNYDEINAWTFWLESGGLGGPPPHFPEIDGSSGYWRSAPNASFVVMGDLNADPSDGESRPGAIQQLLDHPRIKPSPIPASQGAIEAARLQAGKNLTHQSDPASDTADFPDGERGPGNLRVDYVLPSIELDVIGSGVYWPTTDHPHAYLNQASDHRLVWIDLLLD